jgi:hypothetical protein
MQQQALQQQDEELGHISMHVDCIKQQGLMMNEELEQQVLDVILLVFVVFWWMLKHCWVICVCSCPLAAEADDELQGWGAGRSRLLSGAACWCWWAT